MKTLTVFTPSFNRAHLLPRLYKSLCNQTNKDFEWMIIDDGSHDCTEALVKQWIHERIVVIRYFYQENQGMHGAHNTAYQYIQTVLNTCIDSDDYMPINAVQLILAKWYKMNQQKYAGIIGLDGIHNQTTILGTSFNTEETTLEDFYLKGGKGDKKLVYRTEIIKKYPEYPIFKGENYVGLGYKYLLIDKDYKLATLNEKLVIVDYQPTGSSNTMLKQYLLNPKGFEFIRIQSMIYSKSHKRKFIEAIHFVSTSLILKQFNVLKRSPKKLITFLAAPFGVLLYLYIKVKVKNK